MPKVSWDPSITFTISSPSDDNTSNKDKAVSQKRSISNSSPSLCLNMIVKNESRIITRLLKSVVGIIDTYCICDTGSTDNTIEIITDFFNKSGISGKIVREPFRDFGYNRTFALNACNDMLNVDYILLLDADMVFELNPDISPNVFKNMLKDDSYCIFQGSKNFYYKNTRIVKNRKNITYWGVTHEYVNIPNGCVQSSLDKSIAFINDIGDGGSKSDKFSRDIELLKNGLKELPNNDRYTFYLANTYHDSGQFELAIEMYKKRIEIGGWYEEIWYSHYRIGKCYSKLGDMTRAIDSWMNAYEIFPDRVENLLEIITHYRMSGKNKLAYAFYLLANKSRTTYPSRDYLFTDKDAYEYKLDYELSIIGYYTNPEKYDIPKCCMSLVNHPNIDESSIKNIISNYKFYSHALSNKSVDSSILDLSPLYKIGSSLLDELQGLYPSTPSICLDKTGEILTVVKRYVNYSIDEHGGYVNQKNITTKNVVSTFQVNKYSKKLEPMVDSSEFVLQYNTDLDNIYVGLEDMRLYENNGNIFYSCNRGIDFNSIRIEHGKLSKERQSVENSVLLQKPGASKIEKNWVIIEEKEDTLYFIYKWSPLVVGKIDKSSPTEDIPSLFNTVYEYSSPRVFSHLRGSTNGVRINNEIWFLCHTVSYEDRRYYYQIFVVLDADTYIPKYYTPWTTFEKKKVEYSLGFVYMEMVDSFLIGYSLMDSETKYMTVRLSDIKEMLISV
jgi:tetratricopeptide (TPR) repeat protein